jgi:hypothetical protein
VQVVSLPFKLIFFVLVDDWSLVAGSLVQSYGTWRVSRQSGHRFAQCAHVPNSAGTGCALVPRTRSSHDFSAGTVANFGFKRGTRIIELLVPFRFRSSLGGRCECLRTSESGH